MQQQQQQQQQQQPRTPRIEDDYELGDELGSGFFGTVRKGRCLRTGQAVAIKIVPKNKQTAESIRYEASVMKKVSMHKRVASLEAFYETSDEFIIVMEFVSGGDLLEHLCERGAMSEHETATLVSELAGAIALLHAQSMCHADIKPENLLLTADGHIKLVDFGLSAKFVGSERVDPNKGGSPGTLQYFAPEVLKVGEPGLPHDMWALGVLTFCMLTAAHPFDDGGAADEATIMRNITRGEPQWDVNGPWEASEDARSFVGALLRKDPQRRLTIEELLQHPWICNAGADERGVAGGVAAGGATPPSATDAEAAARAEKVRTFRAQSAKLRAACFSLVLQQLAAARAAEAAESEALRRSISHRKGRAALQRHSSIRGPMLEGSLLAHTFRAFDADSKGYIEPADLKRVLANFGQSGVGDDWMEGATKGDREGRRITYGSFVRMMSHAVKQVADTGEYLFRAGDPPQYFYALLNGECEVVRGGADGSEAVVATLRAGEYFGENALLEGASRGRRSSIRCATPVEVLKLSQDDFEAAFGGRRPAGEDAEEAQRSKLLSFVQMVTCQQRRTLRQGEDVFREGDAADMFYILASGRLAVQPEEGSPARAAGAPVGHIAHGECFGEGALLRGQSARNKTLTCTEPRCEVVEILGRDFLRLVEKSRVVRESFERLNVQRTAKSAQAQAAQTESE